MCRAGAGWWVGLNVIPDPNQGNSSRLAKMATGFDPSRTFDARGYLGLALGIPADVGAICPRGSTLKTSAAPLQGENSLYISGLEGSMWDNRALRYIDNRRGGRGVGWIRRFMLTCSLMP